MRSFVISVAIVLICLCISIANCIWTNHRIEDLISDAAALSKDNVEVFISKWKKSESILSFTSRQTYIRDIEDALGAVLPRLTEYYPARDRADITDRVKAVLKARIVLFR